MSARRYRTRRGKWTVYPLGALAGFLGLVLATTPHDVAAAVRVIAIAGVVLVAWITWRAGRIGVETRLDEIIRYGAFRTQRVPWDEVVGLATKRIFTSTLIFLELDGGRRLQTGLVQGVTVIWRGGETNDILSVLQRDLDAHGKETAPEALGSVHLAGSGWTDRGVPDES